MTEPALLATFRTWLRANVSPYAEGCYRASEGELCAFLDQTVFNDP